MRAQQIRPRLLKTLLKSAPRVQVQAGVTCAACDAYAVATIVVETLESEASEEPNPIAQNASVSIHYDGATLDLAISAPERADARAKISHENWQDVTGGRVGDLAELLYNGWLVLAPLPCPLASSTLPFLDLQTPKSPGARQARLVLCCCDTSSTGGSVPLMAALKRCLAFLPVNAAALPPGCTLPDSAAGQKCELIYHLARPKKSDPEWAFPIAGLLPELRAFQKRSLHWMLRRERMLPLHAGMSVAAQSAVLDVRTAKDWFRPLPAQHVATWEAKQVYMDNARLLVTSRAPTAYDDNVLGGCLCEEMGLGKTVEVLACVLANAAKSYTKPASLRSRLNALRGSTPKRHGPLCIVCESSCAGYASIVCHVCNGRMHVDCAGPDFVPAHSTEELCGACMRALASQPLEGQSKATLVVCPTPIQHQWLDELKRHVEPGALTVRVYNGQASAMVAAADSTSVVTAADLGAADVVLTTYDTLRKESDFELDPGADSSSARTMRRARKFHILPTLLTRLQWWRVVLDEAQMVEGPNVGKVTACACHLQTRYRWCVTGTPVSRGTSDLQGLMRFLKASPWSDAATWRRLVDEPVAEGCPAACANLARLLAPSATGLMRRTTKASVEDELQIPPQSSMVRHVQLLPVEAHNYKRVHRETAALAYLALPKEVLDEAKAQGGRISEDRDRVLTDREGDKVSRNLIRLRQICTHAQVGGGSFSDTRPRTLDEVLADLIKKDQQDAQDAQRSLFASQHGVAALALVQGRYAAAVAEYRAVLAEADAHRQEFEPDLLQIIHATFNLDDTLRSDAAAAAGVMRLPVEEDLAHRVEVLKARFMGTSSSALMRAWADFEHAHGQVRLSPGGSEQGGAPGAVCSVGAQNSQGCQAGLCTVDAHCAGEARTPAWWAEALEILETLNPEESDTESDLECASEDEGGDRKTPKAKPQQPSRSEPGDAPSAVSQPPYKKARGSADKAGPSGGGLVNAEGEDEEDEAGAWRVRNKPSIRWVKRCIMEELGNGTANSASLLHNCGSMDELSREVDHYFKMLSRAQAEYVAAVDAIYKQHFQALNSSPDDAFRGRLTRCTRCRVAEGFTYNDTLCDFCALEANLAVWEAHLFYLTCATRGAQRAPFREAAWGYRRQPFMAAEGAAGFESLGRARALLGKATALPGAEELMGPLAAAGVDAGKRFTAFRMTHRPGEVEVLLQGLLAMLRRLDLPEVAAHGWSKERVKALVKQSTKQLTWMENSRSLFYKARQFVNKQKQYVLSHDELMMCTSRMQVGDDAASFGAAFDRMMLHPSEVKVQLTHFQTDKACAHADFKKAVSTLRYALSLKEARRQQFRNSSQATAVSSLAAPSSASSRTTVAGAGDPDTPVATPASTSGTREAQVALAKDAGGQCTLVHGTVGGHVAPCTPGGMCGVGCSKGVPGEALGSGCSTGGPPGDVASLKAVSVADEDMEEGGEECIICCNIMKKECIMGDCLHRWCCDCYARLQRMTVGGTLRCPVCTQPVSRKLEPVQLAPGLVTPEMALPVNSPARKYGAKVQAVVDEVQRTLQESPQDKIIIFSSWATALRVVALALRESGIGCLHGTGKQGLRTAVARFCQEKSAVGTLKALEGVNASKPRARRSRGRAGMADEANDGIGTSSSHVLLLPLRQAGAGLNLTQAQHAFLLEPCTDPAVEAQAVARIHRMNQARSTRVVRFVAQNTVEANVHALSMAKAARMNITSSSSKTGPAEAPLRLSDVTLMLFGENN